MDVKNILDAAKITPYVKWDQFFVRDEKTIKRIVDLADLKRNDIVLEIGAGVGNLTQMLAEKAGKVIAFEIDQRFKPILEKLPKNVELHFSDAWDYVQLHGKFRKRKEFNKIVSNLPYSFVEQLLHNLTFLEYDKAILLIPKSFANKIKIHPIFSSFFDVKIEVEVERIKFYPTPNTNSVVINLIKLLDPVKTKNLGLFLRQYLYQHESQKTKNSLREGIIKFTWLTERKKITKNQTEKMLNETKIDARLLEKPPDNPDIYYQISEKFSEHASLRCYQNASP